MNSTNPVVTIIVVSYNTRELTLECLRSLTRETTTAYQLIVVDNASEDGSASAIAAEFPDVQLLAETTNHGFAKANNLAAKDAAADLLLLLNPDTVVLDGAVDRIVEFAELHPDDRIWGGRTRFSDGSLNPSSCWSRMNMWKIACRTAGLDTAFPDSSLFNGEAYGGWARDSERSVDIVSGCFFLIDRALWQQLGGFDLRFVMYGEEADLCLRARSHGASPRITPTAEIVHYGGASETVRSAKHQRLLRAKITLVKDHFPRWQQPIAIGLLRLWPFSRAMIARLIARFRPNEQNDRRAQEWAAVWSSRQTWQQGYPPLV